MSGKNIFDILAYRTLALLVTLRVLALLNITSESILDLEISFDLLPCRNIHGWAAHKVCAGHLFGTGKRPAYREEKHADLG